MLIRTYQIPGGPRVSISNDGKNRQIPGGSRIVSPEAYLYWIIYPDNLSDPNAAQIIARQDSSSNPAIAYGSAPSREDSGEQIFNAAAGLAQNTWYKVAFVWYDGENYSNVSVSSAWKTLANANGFFFLLFMD